MDRQQLTQWFAEWRSPICKWFRCHCSVPAGEVDDLAQDVFMRLMRYCDTTIENPQAYLFRVASNVAHEWRERARVRHPHDDSWLDEICVDADEEPALVLEREQCTTLVKACIARLPPRQQAILELHIRDGLTYGQIATQRNLTYRIVLRDLTKAYAALRMELKTLSIHPRA